MHYEKIDQENEKHDHRKYIKLVTTLTTSPATSIEHVQGQKWVKMLL